MIRDNIATIQQTIKTVVHACKRTTPVTLIAVSKRKPVTAIKEAIACGQHDFGENYLQEAVEKITVLNDQSGIFHFIGPLQSNKVKLAVGHFDLIHTVDRLKIAKAISKQATNLGKVQKILIQVNVGLEPQKSGVLPDDTDALLKAIQPLPSLDVCGLMTIPPQSKNPEASRPYFRALHDLGIRLKHEGLLAKESAIELSMGMSGDFHIAIEEGATLIRVGTAIFGTRD